ncbi:NAD(P)-dependent oxidoreductase [Nodosilinea sp. E11]|uniref:NAD(P)-dependent oxidoreductase n=1 Tax=Nodosilinea sp. E11 TaxID=3037479 RepID=UPI0029345496|nr:NAD(P)-dependent oxidoreductase [Nodosilinea sp. E11]WOD36966.1 NAD(P)-dependent oxidoreductase [Nodosilinea sp. E11]
MTRIALLGAGAMGSRMAQNLLKAQYKLIVYNRTADKVKPLIDQGAVYADNPKAAAEQADIVISMVTNNESSRNVWLDPKVGAALGLNKTSIAIESSTLTVGYIRELAAAITQRGAALLDAPVVGSRPQAEAGKLIYLVGGEAETLAQVQTVLSSAGASEIHHLGENGQGMAMKLAVNALFGIQVAALAEALGMLAKGGISGDRAMALLGELPILSPAAKLAGNLMLTGNHAPLFPIELVEKDFRYAIATEQTSGAKMPIATALQDVYQKAITEGYGKDNITGVIQLFV